MNIVNGRENQLKRLLTAIGNSIKFFYTFANANL